MNFFEKFFGYVYDIDGNYVPYFDELGKGAFSDWRHFAWMIFTIVIGIVLYQIFKKKPKIGKMTISILLGLLFATRLVNQTVRAIIGAEVPFWRAFPFHLCTIMTFLLPLTYFFKWDKIKVPIYVLSMMGGIITIIIGDYFDSKFMTFSTLEGMSAHMILALIPIFEIAIGEFSLKYKEIWKPFAFMVILLGWAFFANEVLFRNYDTNYMYLRKNGLPGNIGGDYYLLIYAGIFILLINIIFLCPYFYRKINKQNAK